jgi:DNA (cytosine-5)-methyltransferase 1
VYSAIQEQGGFSHGSLFSGIGGFDLASEWMGWDNKFHCEWNEFGRKVLHYYWPNATSYGDITKTDFTFWRGKIDILTGGFPCQPYSSAGKRKGKEDDRHLWPEMLRVIREIRPRWILGENVYGLVNWSDGLVFEEVQSDLEAEGYEVQPCVLPAAAVNAPHRRDRVWFIAYANIERLEGRIRKGAQGRSDGLANDGKKWTNTNANIERLQGNWKERKNKKWENTEGHFGQSVRAWDEWPTQSPICSGDDGLSEQLDGITFPKWRQESIKAYGNAIVPQVALQIFRAVEEYEQAYQ